MCSHSHLDLDLKTETSSVLPVLLESTMVGSFFGKAVVHFVIKFDIGTDCFPST